MVKNIGGNRAKKLGRKFVNDKETVDSGVGLKTRFSQDPCEMYAAVTKEYGNGRAGVRCIDGVERSMIIRKKFKGRGKRGCFVKAGSWVLVGIRDWESRSAKAVEVCDLLEVYSNEDIAYLKTNIESPWYVLNGIGKISNGEDEGGDFALSDDDLHNGIIDGKSAQYITFSDDEDDDAGGKELDLDDL